MLRRPSLLALIATAAAAVLTALPATAHGAVERKVLDPNDDASGLVIVSPFRIEETVEPGQRMVVEMTLTNDSDKTVDVTLSPTDLAASSDPRSFVDQVEDGEFGAGDWLFPEVTDDRLQPWEQIRFNLVIDPPTTAPVGTNLAGLSVDSAIAQGTPGTGDQLTGAFRAEALVQVFLTVPGPVEHRLRIVDVDTRDTVVIGSQRFVVWDITFRNDGTLNEHVSGSIDVRSIFGNRAARVPIDENIVLRGSTRTQRVIWRDLPWVGVFTPEVRVRGDDAKLVEHTGERVVICPWWLPVLIVLLVVAPALWLWWRRRQEWKMYLEDETADDAVDWDPDGTGAHS